MFKALLGLFLIISTVTAQDDTTLESDNNLTRQESDLYLSYEKLPKKIYKNQIFTVTTKVLNTNKNNSLLSASFGNFYGVKVLSLKPYRIQKDFTYYDTFYFQATETNLQTPDLFYKLLRSSEYEYTPVKLSGKKSFALNLNTDAEFSHLLAKKFTIESYKTTHYDQNNNIIVFTAATDFANIDDFNISVASIQGFESISGDLPSQRMTYYAVIPKHLRSLNFNYFNLSDDHYIPITIPIEVDDDSVSTQMDLSPTQYNHSFAKIMIALGFILLGIILYLITRKKIYFFMIALTPILYVAWVYFPKEKLCIKSDAKIYLLPMKNSTIFHKYSSVQKLQKMGKVDEYNKVLLSNLNIGWVKDEDICED